MSRVRAVRVREGQEGGGEALGCETGETLALLREDGRRGWCRADDGREGWVALDRLVDVPAWP